MELIELSKKSKEIIKPFGQTDVLLYYGIVAEKLKKYLAGKEIAAKIWLGKKGFMPYLIKRGSKLEPLYIEELKEITPEFLEARHKGNLNAAKGKINKTQAKIWDYFLPRHLSDLFYATNNEKAKKPIERIFFDIDRGNVKAENAQKAAAELIDVIKADDKFWDLVKGELFVMWTGNSFHVYVFLDKEIPISFYDEYIAYSKNEPLASFTGRWAKKISEELKIKVVGGHEKQKGMVNIDPSQTPSGKLCRSLFSLHMKDENTIDGVALPLSLDMTKGKSLINELGKYSPERVINELNELSQRLPKKFKR